MIIGTGIDVVVVSRIADALDKHGDRYVKRVYTEREAAYCGGKKRGAMQAYAVRYAAKEAVAKALGIGIRKGVNFKDIEVVLNPLGKPSVKLHNTAAEVAAQQNVSTIHIALSHEGEWAVAFALAEREEE